MDELERLGRARTRAKIAFDSATDHLKAAVIAAARAGRPEVEVARLAGVDRMTVRSWTGKRRRSVDSSTHDGVESST